MNAEAYLRALGAATVDTPRIPRAPSPLLAATQALVVVEAIEEGAAQVLLDEHEVERHRRLPDEGWAWAREWPTEPLRDRRVSLAAGRMEHPAGALDVHYVVLAPDTTSVEVSLVTGHRRARKPADPFGGEVELGDDRGNRCPAMFSGAGARRGWDGTLHGLGPLDARTSWLALDGRRVDLVGEPAAAQIEIEPLPAPPTALSHLRRCAALSSLGCEALFEAALDALIAAGAVASDEPELATLRQASAALAAWDDRTARRLGAPLPDPWGGLWRRGTGPELTVAIGAATPLFAEVSVVVDALRSTADGWSIVIETVPEGAMPHPFEAPTARPTSLVWWAVDDHGHRYLATRGGGGGNARGGRGELRFSPPLDATARWVELHPETETTRARIRIPLDGAGA